MNLRQEKLALIEKSIISVPDYPIKGVLFRDITGLLENATAFADSVELLIDHYKNKGIKKVVGTEARGFIFGAPLALGLKCGFVPVRKPNKLPRRVMKAEYELEYGKDKLEIHADSIQPNEKVLIVDDLLATGGTVTATVSLIRQLGGIIEDAAFVINLCELGGQEKLTHQNIKCFSLINF